MKATDKKLWIPLLGGAAIILGSFWLAFRDQDISDHISDWSYFGAYVGGCFGIVSVVLIYLTFREQSKMAYQTRVESVFFEMLRTLREINNDEVKSLFSNLSKKLSCHFAVEFGYDSVPKEDLRGVIRYYISYQEQYPQISHYFRYLYHIIKYVENDNILDEKEKEKYIALIQAQMSNNELLMTLFNVIGYNNTTYLGWLDKYGFFENLQTESRFLDYIRSLFFPTTKNKHPQPPKRSTEEALTEWYEELCTNLDEEQCIDTIKRLKKKNQ